jgi:membrane dipeptidase
MLKFHQTSLPFIAREGVYMQEKKDYLSRANTLHSRCLVVDAHHDILMDVFKQRRRGTKARLNSYWGPKLAAGGVNVQVLPVYIDSDYLPESALRVTLRMIESYHADLEDDDSLIAPASSFQDIEKRLAEGKIPAILGIEGAEGLGSNLDLFHTMYRLGVRVIGLTWNHRNAFADGTGEQETNGGLTKLGFEAIREMNQLNILIDVSHINQACFFDVLESTDTTVIASHSNARGIFDHPRNLSDEQIKSLAENGGVMGLLIHPGIIDPDKPTISRCVDHLAYVSDLVGVDHVGLGTDFTSDALAEPIDEELAKLAMVDVEVLRSGIKGLNRIDDLPNLTTEMVRRGFSEEEIEKILGKNFLRVFKKVLS